MDAEATLQAADRGPEAGAIRAVRHREMSRQRLEVQR